LKPESGLAQAADHTRMILMRTVREVQARYIDPRRQESLNRLSVLAGRTNRSNDFRAAAHKLHQVKLSGLAHEIIAEIGVSDADQGLSALADALAI